MIVHDDTWWYILYMIKHDDADCKWLYMTTCDYTYDCIWLYMIKYDYIWLYMIIWVYDFIWLHMIIYDYISL